MKKCICLFLTLVLTMTCLNGCGEKEPAADGKTVIDVFAGLDIRFSESWNHESMKNGFGNIEYSYELAKRHFSVDKVDYDKTNADIKAFLKSIKFNWVEKEDMSNRLKNGDVIHIALEYSKSTAEELDIRVLEETKAYTVSGLADVYRKESEVNKEVLDTAYTLANRTDVETLDNVLDINWYLEDEDGYYPTFTYKTSTRTFYEYYEDNSQDLYIKNFLLLVRVDCESDYHDPGNSIDGTYFNEPAFFLRRLELDGTRGDYTWGLNPEGNKQAMTIVLKKIFTQPENDFNEGYALDASGKLTCKNERSKKIVEFTY